jgi:hypothetical protein
MYLLSVAAVEVVKQLLLAQVQVAVEELVV